MARRNWKWWQHILAGMVAIWFMVGLLFFFVALFTADITAYSIAFFFLIGAAIFFVFGVITVDDD